jgi:hypothetical protein
VQTKLHLAQLALDPSILAGLAIQLISRAVVVVSTVVVQEVARGHRGVLGPLSFWVY